MCVVQTRIIVRNTDAKDRKMREKNSIGKRIISDLGTFTEGHREVTERHRVIVLTAFLSPHPGGLGGRKKGISDFGIGISDLVIKNFHRGTQRSHRETQSYSINRIS